MKKIASPLKTALWIFLGSFALAALIFPEVFWQQKVSFLDWGDYLIDYHSTFALTGFFYQGGIQLWDFFGQLPHTFFWVTHGMFRLPNILVAIVYYVLSPFTDDSARFYHQVFSIVYTGTLLGIRAIGIYLLLKRITADKWILRAGTVIFAVLFCPPAFMMGTFYQSYYPLLMYFILSFFLTWRLVYLGMSMLFLILSFGQGIAHTCYMYLGINLFLVSCAVYSVLAHPVNRRQCREFFVKNSRALRMGAMGLLALGIVILGPYVYMQLLCLKDVDFDAGHSRLSGMWSVSHYFHSLALDQSPPADFFRRMLDFTLMSGRSFFLGNMMFFLSGLALTMSQDRRKWIFIGAVLLVWSLNFPRDTFSIGLIGHWVNVLTNPLKTMVRSYQTSINSIIGYLLMPLAVMGLEVLKGLGRETFKFTRVRWLLIFMVIYAVNGCSQQSSIVRIYFILSMFFSLMALALLMFARNNELMRGMAKALFIGLILTDMALSAWQMKHYLSANCRLRPHVVEFLPPQTGTVGLDFRNPKIYPFVAQTDTYPVEDQPNFWTLADLSLNYNGLINRVKSFVPPGSEIPRHISFLGWQNDPLMKEFVVQNNRLFFFAPYAVRQGPGVFENIVRRAWTGDVLMVDGQVPSLMAQMPPHIQPSDKGEDQWISIPANLRDTQPGWIYENGMMIWDFPIQGKIPGYLATNIFTHDHWVRFFVQSPDQKFVELAPAQGQLIRPMTFDVQNIKEGKVFVALPANTSLVGLKGILLLKARDACGITSVWLHHSDDTGVTFQAPADGWLGIQYPYDPKWRIEIDGNPTKFYRADKSFIGVPITQGEHKILIRYWPGSWLRWGLPLSALLTSVLFIILIFYALHEAAYE